MKNESEKHQFGFSFMRTDTGGQRVHSFWGYGDVETAKTKASESAKAYARSYESELNEKARQKAERRGDRYAPSHIGVQIVNCSLWR